MTYRALQAQYINFCEKYQLLPLPASEQTLLRFLASLSLRPGRYGPGLAPSSLQSFLAAIRNLHVTSGYAPPPTNSPRIALLIKSVSLSAPAPVQKHPIGFKLLKHFWPLFPSGYNGVLLRSIVTLAYFGCLRGAEYGLSETIHGVLLSAPPKLSAVSFEKINCITYMTYTVPRSKTLIRGFQRTIGCSEHFICAFCCMKEYLVHRKTLGINSPESALFIWSNKSVVHKSHINLVLKDLAKQLGLDPKSYSTHSLRSGSVSDGSGILPDWLLKSMGGWKSNQYQSYIRNTTVQHAAVAKALVGSQ